MGLRTNTAVWLDKYQRWQVNVQRDGERRSFCSSIQGRDGQREANKKADDWLDRGIMNPNIRCEKIYEMFLEERKKKVLSWRQDDSYWRCWISPVIGKKKAGSLCDDHIQTIIDNAYTAGLSKKTIMDIKAAAVMFVKYCRRKRVTAYVPDEVAIPKNARIGERKILQPEDMVKLFVSDKTLFKGKVVTDPFVHSYRFMVLTGCRPGELYGLERTDRSGVLLHIRRSINESNKVTKGKNENAIRTFQLTKSAITEWDAQKKLTPFSRKAFYDGKPKAMLRYWKRYCDYNRIPYVTLYELRHTFVSAIKELPEGWLKQLIGHSKIMDSYGTYGHAMKGERALMANRIDAIFQDIINSEQSPVEISVLNNVLSGSI